MEEGEFASVVVQFLEDRNGRALVRLPNGSKTSVAYDAIVPTGVDGIHIVMCGAGPNEVFCQRCDWHATGESYQAAFELARAHVETDHID